MRHVALQSANLNVMQKAAEKAARGLKRDFGEVEQLQVTQKGPADFVTNADLRTEKILMEELQKARPDYGFFMEEGGPIEGADKIHRWIIDPIDGTTNFMHGIPHFAIFIALERSGEIIAGLVYDPIKEETFTAEKGAGAYLNDKRLRVSGRKHLNEIVLATGIPFKGHGNTEKFSSQLSRAMAETSGVRRFGAASLDLAYVAAGRYDGYWEDNLSPWDIAAGIILVREAGGVVNELNGGSAMMQSGSILATNMVLFSPLRQLLG